METTQCLALFRFVDRDSHLLRIPIEWKHDTRQGTDVPKTTARIAKVVIRS